MSLDTADRIPTEQYEPKGGDRPDSVPMRLRKIRDLYRPLLLKMGRLKVEKLLKGNAA